MKHLISLLSFYLFASSLFSQITTIEDAHTVKTPKKIIPIVYPYDSLSPINIELYVSGDFNKDKFYQNRKYIGQKIFLPANNNNLILSKVRTIYRGSDSKYFDFVVPYDGVGSRNFEIWTNVYKPIESGLDENEIQHATSENAFNRYYTITDIILDFDGGYSEENEYQSKKQNEIVNLLYLKNWPKNVMYNEGQEKGQKNNKSGKYNQDLLIEMRDDISGDTLYMHSNEDFISVGFFCKVKRMFDNKKILWYNAIDPTMDHSATLTDFISQKEFNIDEIGSVFKCTSISVYKNSIIVILENEKGQITQEIKSLRLKTKEDIPFFYHSIFPTHNQFSDIYLSYLNFLACGMNTGLMFEEDLNILNTELSLQNRKEYQKKQVNQNKHTKNK